MVNAKNPGLVVSSILFNNSTIQDASLNVVSNNYGGAVKCVLLQVNGTDLSNNIFLKDPNATDNTQAFQLSTRPPTGLPTQSFFGAPSISIFDGYITGTILFCKSSPTAMQICPTFNVTGPGVSPGTIITRYIISDGSGNIGQYPINISQTVGSLSSPVTFTCTPQPVTFIGALTRDPATSNNSTTSLYTNQGNAYQSGGFPVIGMTLTGNAITFGGTTVNVKIFNRAGGSAANPFFDQTLPSGSPVITSTPGQMLLTTIVDASGALFRGLVSNNTRLTVTSINFGTVNIGHFLTGCNIDRSSILSNPAPTIVSFDPTGSYSFFCTCDASGTILNVSAIPSTPANNNCYTIPDTSLTPPKPYRVFISGTDTINKKVIPPNTYWLTGLSSQDSRSSGTRYNLNQAIPGGIGSKSNMTLTVTTISAAGTGGIGIYTLSSNQPYIAISNTSNLLSGPLITGTLI
jgi:hypothetical protein